MWTTRRRRHSPQVMTTATTTALLPTRARLPSRRPTLLRPSTRAARSARYFTNTRTERTHTHVQRPFVRDPQVSRYQKGKTSLDFTEARDSEWQWHQLGQMQVCTLLQTDNPRQHPTTLFFTGWMPFLPPNQQRQSFECTRVFRKL